MAPVQDIVVSQLDVLVSLSSAVDLVSPALTNHHKRVASIALSIANELGLSRDQRGNLILAGALHDIGALSLGERLETLRFEIKSPHRHAEIGGFLIQSLEPLAGSASLVRYHHVPWNEGAGREFNGEEVPLGSHVLHLADRVDVMIDKRRDVLGQASRICKKIKELSGKWFVPEMVEAFISLASKESFWFDVVSPSSDSFRLDLTGLPRMELDQEGLLDLARLYRKIIDFRSSFTSTHSSGVAHCAESLARLVGFGQRRCQMVKIAGYLHDLGKLRVPAEILEKPGRLNEREFAIVRSHPYFTYRVLGKIRGLEDINMYASFHHERLNGRGYPFHIGDDDLLLGSRIMAVADVFTAIAEDRPYRKGMSESEVRRVLDQLVKDRALDGNVVSLLIRNFDEVNSARAEAQESARREYQEFKRL